MLKILIFDSGVGGLSISQSLTDCLPSAAQILLSDNAYFPYGEMNEADLITRVTNLLIKAAFHLQPDCIVIACNTVSTVALEKIRAAVTIPVVGVVPAIKPAAEISVGKVIGLLATPATVNRSYTAELVNSFAEDCLLISVGSTRLVEIAEQKLRGIAVDPIEVKAIVETFILAEKEQHLDTIVLGCTHFPLLSDCLTKVLPTSIRLVDSSTAIARQVKKVLGLEEVSAKQQKQLPNHRCLMTKQADFTGLDAGLKQFGFSPAEIFD